MRYDDEPTEGILPAHETGGVLMGMADALLLSIDGSRDGSRFGEELVLRVSPPSPPTYAVQRMLVCVTCNAVVARSKEAPSLYDEPVLFASAMERGLKQHFEATGHRGARCEHRVMFVGSEDGEA